MQFRSDMSVSLIKANVDDADVVQAARVSTQGAAADAEVNRRLIAFLMRNRHGSPFEHGSMTFLITAPIFVWREYMRHRIGFSYNEESGRYKELDPVFYIPDRERKLVQVGKAGAYEFIDGTEEQYQLLVQELKVGSQAAYESYQRLLDAGIARECARWRLPLNIYSSAFVTCNARSLMAFLSLRTHEPEALFPSKPMREIEMVAERMEDTWQALMPFTAQAFDEGRRVGP